MDEQEKAASEKQSGGVNVSGEIKSIGGDVVGGNKIVVQANERTSERDVIYKLLVFLEDRRLLTEEFGYQSHFPDPLRLSAQEIRRQTVEAIQSLEPGSTLIPILNRLRAAARNFQAATEGAMDGYRAGGGMSPVTPMGLSNYLDSLLRYRQEIATAIVEAADSQGLEIDPSIRGHAHVDGRARELIDGLRRSGR